MDIVCETVLRVEECLKLLRICSSILHVSYETLSYSHTVYEDMMIVQS